MECFFNWLILGLILVRIMPQKMREILAVEETRSRVLSRNDASDVLRDALQKTEEALDYEYEVLLQ